MNDSGKTLLNPACTDRLFRIAAAGSALLAPLLLAALLVQLGIGPGGSSARDS